MQINDKIKTECVDLNHQGLGVCKVDSFPIFVGNIITDEIGIIEITKLQKNYGYGKLIELKKTSPFRVKPRCPIFGICGGCEIMHLDYQQQLEHKVKMAEETFKRIGHLDLKVDRIIGMDDPYYYRNKVQIPYQMKKGKVICGFYQKGTHDIVPFDECFIQPKQATDIAQFVRNLANEFKITAYDEITKQGNLRHVLIRKTANDNYMVVLITKEEIIPHVEKIVSKINNRYSNVKTIIQNINKKDTNVILGPSSKVLYGPGILIDDLMGLKFKVSHQSFFQTNHIQTNKLYQQVLDYLKPKANDIVIDGYCGVGTISLLLASKCKYVYGIEIVEEAIKDAKENAGLNGINNVEFIVGKTEEEIQKINESIDAIVVDPPRKGCDRSLLDAIIEKAIKKIVYVSCDVATLARDLEILAKAYDIKGITLVDMFPHISDVETCVLLSFKH